MKDKLFAYLYVSLVAIVVVMFAVVGPRLVLG